MVGLGLVALALQGCPTPSEPVDPGEHPCALVWGPSPPSGRLFVAPGGSGVGSLADPYGTIEEALTASRLGGERSIALDAGTYSDALVLQSSSGDDGLTITGCGVDATVITPLTEGEASTAVLVAGGGTHDITLREFSVVGGRRALAIAGGAGSGGPILLESLAVLDSVRLGVLIDGADTVATLDGVVVDGVSSEAGEFGWGIAVQTGRQLSSPFVAPVTLLEVSVSDAQGFGILVDGAWVEMTGVSITDTTSVGGLWGRGLQAQSWSMGTIVGLESSGNRDAAVFLVQPGRPDPSSVGGDVLPLSLLDSVLGPTSVAAIPQSASEAADGLTAIQDVGDGAPYPPETFLVVLDGLELTGNSRAHVLGEGVALQVGPNNVFGKGAGYPVAAQDGATVQGLGGGAPPVSVTTLDAASALDINRDAVALDAL